MSIHTDNKTDVSFLALEATLTAMKGAGWTNESLKAIKDAVDAMVPGPTAAAIWGFITRKLTNLDDVRAARIDNLDALISSRSSHSPNDVRDAILDDATRFSGADIDAPISSRSTLIQAQILSDATPFPGANVDAAVSSRAPANEYDVEMARLDVNVSSRSSHSAADVWAVVARSLTDKAGFSLSAAGLDAVRQSVCLIGDPANSIGKAMYELYVNRLTAGRAVNMDNLDATVSSRLAAAAYTAERGTDNAALAVDYTAVRAAKLDGVGFELIYENSLAAGTYVTPTVSGIFQAYMYPATVKLQAEVYYTPTSYWFPALPVLTAAGIATEGIMSFPMIGEANKIRFKNNDAGAAPVRVNKIG